MKNSRLDSSFYQRDVLTVAPELLGKYIARSFGNKRLETYLITEVEAYRGFEDKACHASKGRTSRTEVMYQKGGLVYVYFIYGIHWMLNFVTGEVDNPQAILIRGVKNVTGPGRVSRLLEIDKSFYGEDLMTSRRIWVFESGMKVSINKGPRIGVDYAGPVWANKPWRFWCEIPEMGFTN
jgi:DNA-3-methyladenine glycosylase